MSAVAWLVIGEPHYRAVFLEYERAVQQAVGCHGIVKPLVFEEHVYAMLAAAFQRGAESGDTRKE